MSGRLHYNLERTVGPTEDPITKEVAKRQCNIEDAETFFDTWFEGNTNDNVGVIAAATEMVEYDARVALMPQTWELRLDGWPEGEDWIDLRVHPVQSVVVAYEDEADATQTWAGSNYELQTGRYRSRLMKTDKDTDFPNLSTSDPLPVKITITAGYSNTTDQTTAPVRRNKVPRAARMAIMVLLGHWFKNRESVLVGSISKPIEQSYWSLIRSIRPERYG